jgi:hypothetical protein
MIGKRFVYVSAFVCCVAALLLCTALADLAEALQLTAEGALCKNLFSEMTRLHMMIHDSFVRADLLSVLILNHFTALWWLACEEYCTDCESGIGEVCVAAPSPYAYVSNQRAEKNRRSNRHSAIHTHLRLRMLSGFRREV